MSTGALVKPIGLRKWAPRDTIAPYVSGDIDTSLRVVSNGSPGCYGGWEVIYPAGAVGDHFLFRVQVRWQETKAEHESLSAEAMWEDEAGNSIDWDPIHHWEQEDGWVIYSGVIANRSGAKRLVIKLLMRWTATGAVEWRQPELFSVDASPARKLRLGAATSPPPPDTTLEKNRDRFVALCERAGEQGVELLCLPEVILSWGLRRQPPAQALASAVEVPGPHIEPFCQVAARHRMAIVLSVSERDGELKYNTAVLIDEKGHIAAKYRKVHLATPYEMWQGTTPGDTFPVAPVGDVGVKVGMNICMDSSAAEACRMVARLGAEVLLMPIMGDHRSDGFVLNKPSFDLGRWRVIQQMRAMDNQIYVVASRNNGVGSGVFAPDGTILAENQGDCDIIWADIDLNSVKRDWTGAAFKDVCWFQRRESLYKPLAGSMAPRI